MRIFSVQNSEVYENQSYHLPEGDGLYNNTNSGIEKNVGLDITLRLKQLIKIQ